MLENIEYFQRDFTLIKSVKKSLGGEMTGLYLLGGLLTHSCTQNIRCVFKVIPQRNHWYRGTTELVQHFAYRGNSYRRKGAARYILYMVWLYSSPYPVKRRGILLVQMIFYLPSRRLEEGVSTLWVIPNQFSQAWFIKRWLTEWSFKYFQGKNHKLHVYASMPIKKGEKDLLNIMYFLACFAVSCLAFEILVAIDIFCNYVR